MPTAALELREDDFRDAARPLPADPRRTSAGILSGRLAAATRRHATRGRRGEAVALVAAPVAGAAPCPSVLAAARGREPGLGGGDRRGRARSSEALSRLDDALLEHRTVVLAARARPGRSLPLLLEHVDRAVVLLTEEAEATRPAPRRPPPRRRVELVLAGPGAHRAAAATWCARVERRGAGLRGGRRGLARAGTWPAPSWGWRSARAARRATPTSGRCRCSRRRATRSTASAAAASARSWAPTSRSGMGAAEIEATLRDAFTPETRRRGLQAVAQRASRPGATRCSASSRETTGERSFEETRDPARGHGGRPQRAACPPRCARARSGRRCWPPRRSPGCSRRTSATGSGWSTGWRSCPCPPGAVAADGADVTVAVNIMSRDTLAAWPGQAPPEPEPPKRRGSRMLETLLEVMDVSQLDTSIAPRRARPT